MIKAAIYDMDDLLVNSCAIHFKSLRAVFSRRDSNFDSIPEPILESFVGKRLIDIIEEATTFFRLPDDPKALNQERETIFLELAEKELELLPGAKKSLEMFRTNGLIIALASSATHAYIDLVLRKFSLEPFFSAIVSGQDVARGKPDPETYRKAAEKLGTPPEQCVVLEDAANGIAAAKGAGCKCIGVINTFTPPQDRSKADLVINSLEEIAMDMIISL